MDNPSSSIFLQIVTVYMWNASPIILHPPIHWLFSFEKVFYGDLSIDQPRQIAIFTVLLLAPWISWFLGLWWAIYCRMQCLIPRIQMYKMVSSVSTFSVPKLQNYTDGDSPVLCHFLNRTPTKCLSEELLFTGTKWFIRNKASMFLWLRLWMEFLPPSTPPSSACWCVPGINFKD